MRAGSRLLATVLATGFVVAHAATAQEPTQLSGEIVSVSSDRLTLKRDNGEQAEVQLGAETRILKIEASELEGLSAETFVSAAGEAAGETEEHITADVVIVYPDDMTGTAEGYFLWQTTPESRMISGVVREIDKADGAGIVLGLRYPQGGATVEVPADATVVKLDEAAKESLSQGMHAYIPAAQPAQGGGALTAETIAVGEKDLLPRL